MLAQRLEPFGQEELPGQPEQVVASVMLELVLELQIYRIRYRTYLCLLVCCSEDTCPRLHWDRLAKLIEPFELLEPSGSFELEPFDSEPVLHSLWLAELVGDWMEFPFLVRRLRS